MSVSSSAPCCVAIVGRSKDTVNYENAFRQLGIPSITTLSTGEIRACQGLLLPGGGDITPAFFGQKNAGSKNIDTELDILQLQALEYAVRAGLPVLGICKGMQIINVYFGGTIIQHMPLYKTHAYNDGDRYHDTTAVAGTLLASLYGGSFMVNSAHHQCIDLPGRGLSVIQSAADGTPEALYHDTLPVLGVQWHPERLLPFQENSSTLLAGTDGSLLLGRFGARCLQAAEA